MRKLGFLLIVCAVSVEIGCAPRNGESPDVADVLPTAESVRINLPDSAEQQLALGDIADTYVWTRQTTRELNTGAGFTLVVLHAIVHLPPTRVDGDTVVWEGSDPLDPAVWRLEVTEFSPGIYDYVLSGDPKFDDGETRYVLIDGTAHEGTRPHRGNGELTLHFDNLAVVDPTDHGDFAGTIEIKYDLENRDGTQASLEMHFDGPRDDGHGGVVDLVADYRYAEAADGSGDFEFMWIGDIDENGSEFETAEIRARWLATGEGRARVGATGGDMGESEAEIEECWDARFRLVYGDYSHPDGSSTVGDDGDCASGLPTAP